LANIVSHTGHFIDLGLGPVFAKTVANMAKLGFS